METLQGIPAVGGVGIGPLVIYRRANLSGVNAPFAAGKSERERLDAALEAAGGELTALAANVRIELGDEQAAIFEAQAMIAADPALHDSAAQLVAGGSDTPAAIRAAGAEYAAMLASLEDQYLSERAADVRDVAARVERILRGQRESLPTLTQPSILLADDLTPSETAILDANLVRGIALAEGGLTSHVVVVARNKSIPVIVGLGGLPDDEGATAILDGDGGKLIVAPDEVTLTDYRQRQQAAAAVQQRQRGLREQPAVSRDGVRVRLVANIGSVADAEALAENGAEGIGLLRTEFLFLEHEPSVNEQTEVYRHIFATVSGEIVARTMDLGGDKPPPYLEFGNEANPFLGWRGLRIGLERRDMLLTQLRALLKAAAGRKLGIMFPMVATVEELRAAKAIVRQAQQIVGDEQPSELEVGIMVEVPAAAMMADALAQECDFFSIGSNDLTQYIMAADRGNSHVASLYSTAQPAVLRMIACTVKAAHAASRWVGICGEAGGDPQLTPLWLGLGIDELSMAAPLIPAVKEVILNRNAADCRELAAKALRYATLDQVMKLL
jgi:phosphoenolpyruvate-protein phosphotransferase